MDSSSAACVCGQRDAEREPDATDRVIVPTAADCPVHGSSAAKSPVAGEPGGAATSPGSSAAQDRLFVNDERTVLVRIWASGTVEVARREAPDHVWGPPVYVVEEQA